MKSLKDNSYIYFILEVCYGITVNKFYQTVNPIKDDFIKFVIAQVILGLENLHSRFIIYRDLKASNVIIDSKGKVKILDFGFGKKLENGEKFLISNYLELILIAEQLTQWLQSSLQIQ